MNTILVQLDKYFWKSTRLLYITNSLCGFQTFCEKIPSLHNKKNWFIFVFLYYRDRFQCCTATNSRQEGFVNVQPVQCAQSYRQKSTTNTKSSIRSRQSPKFSKSSKISRTTIKVGINFYGYENRDGRSRTIKRLIYFLRIFLNTLNLVYWNTKQCLVINKIFKFK